MPILLRGIEFYAFSEYQRFFDMFDRGKQGYIMATQIGQIMHAMEQDFDEKTLRKLVRKFDADGSGKLEFDEFCALVYTVANTVDKDTLQRELREAFRLFDKEACPFNVMSLSSPGNESIVWQLIFILNDEKSIKSQSLQILRGKAKNF